MFLICSWYPLEKAFFFFFWFVYPFESVLVGETVKILRTELYTERREWNAVTLSRRMCPSNTWWDIVHLRLNFALCWNAHKVFILLCFQCRRPWLYWKVQHLVFTFLNFSHRNLLLSLSFMAASSVNSLLSSPILQDTMNISFKCWVLLTQRQT